MIEPCYACGRTDCMCAHFGPDCPACGHPDDQCVCPEEPDRFDRDFDGWDDYDLDEMQTPAQGLATGLAP